MVGLSAGSVATAYAIGAAALGLWAVVRHPSRGPQSVGGAMLVAACSFAVLLASGPLTRAAVAAAGPGAALLVVVLPTLTLAFWSAAHVVRLGLERLTP